MLPPESYWKRLRVIPARRRYGAAGAAWREWVADLDGSLLFWVDDPGPWLRHEFPMAMLHNRTRWCNRLTAAWFEEDKSHWAVLPAQ